MPDADIVFVPLTNSDALTVTAVPVFVPPVMYPVVLVTDGVTLTLWFVTVPLVAVGVPVDPLATVLLALFA